mgnify:CR=1 FL=1
MTIQTCPVCHSAMSRGLKSWHLEFGSCGYEKSELKPAINEALAHEQINEQFREEGLRSVRNANFNELLKSIINVLSSPGYNRLLDVGCAHGWFLETAQKKGFEAHGIEPDRVVYEATAKSGLSIRQGFFPEALEANEQFDVIVVNDVFGHLPDLTSVLQGCENHLTSRGILVLNLPSSSGFFYKTARLLSKLGINGFFERLWQKGLPSPHLHYFNAMNLRELLRNNGFEEISNGQLSALKLQGLFARISYTKEHILPIRLLIFLVVAIALPLTKMIPSDIIYSVSRKKLSH